MDIEIVNTILKLCTEKQTCLFEVPFLSNYCVEHHLCNNPKYVLASIKNYTEIFKISRDKNRIEFFMPFEICRNKFIDGKCEHNDGVRSNFHICYDYFYTNSCRHSINCPYPHKLTEQYHKTILGPLISLDLDILTKAFRVYCQSKKHMINSNSLKIQQTNLILPLTNNSTPSSSIANNERHVLSAQINGNSSWKTNKQFLITLRTLPKEQSTIPTFPDKGVQICWKPNKDIQTHFIEVIFSNQAKSNGGPIQTHDIYQHLGIAQVFYQNLDIAERVATHGPIKFQSFTFTSRLLRRSIDKRHVCFCNVPTEISKISSYIDMVSVPYKKLNIEYYHNDKQTLIVEYNEDIDFSRISSNIRHRPECNGFMINCIRLYLPETLFIEHDKEWSEDNIIQLFDRKNIFHIKSYSYCSFVHFYSHEDLLQSINRTYDNFIQVTPIYIDIYSEKHLNNYLQRRQMENELKPSITLSPSLENRGTVSPTKTDAFNPNTQSSIPILCPPPVDKKPEFQSAITENLNSTSTSKQEPIKSQAQSQIGVEKTSNETSVSSDEDESVESEDDFHDLPSDFENDELLLDDTTDDQDDMEYLRSAAKNLMTSLAEMEESDATVETDDTPRSLLYGDDYYITIKSRRFTLAFLDYTQFRIERQRNPDKFHLISALRKLSNNKKRIEQIKDANQTVSSLATTEAKPNKKKRHKRNKKKKVSQNHEKDDEIDTAN